MKVIPDPSPSKTTVPISSSKRTPRIQLSTDMSSFPTHFGAKMCYTFYPNVVFKDGSASNLVR